MGLLDNEVPWNTLNLGESFINIWVGILKGTHGIKRNITGIDWQGIPREHIGFLVILLQLLYRKVPCNIWYPKGEILLGDNGLLSKLFLCPS